MLQFAIMSVDDMRAPCIHKDPHSNDHLSQRWIKIIAIPLIVICDVSIDILNDIIPENKQNSIAIVGDTCMHTQSTTSPCWYLLYLGHT